VKEEYHGTVTVFDLLLPRIIW